MSILQRPGDIGLLLLLCYFMFFNVTIERSYCHATLEEAAKQDAFLAQTTIDFCKEANPLFLRREPWMRMAVCWILSPAF